MLKSALRSTLKSACIFLLLASVSAISRAQSPSFTEYSIPTPVSSARSITTGPDSALWFTEGIGKIGRISTSGAITEYVVPTPSASPIGITAGPDTALWFTEFNGNNIGRITTAGAITEYPVPTPSAGLIGITAGPDGALWFTEGIANKIGRITTSGAITEYPIAAPDVYPDDITAGPDGNLWFTGYSGQQNANDVGSITTAGFITLYSTPPPPADGYGITAGPDGNLWFTEFYLSLVGSITPGGVVTQYALAAESSPSYIATGPDGALWFTEYSSGILGRITTSGAITQYSIPTLNSGPQGITTGPDGALWFTEYTANQIARAAITPPAPLLFVPVTPCRVVDTRNPDGPFGGPELDGNSRSFDIPAGACSIPSNAAAYSLNVTVVPSGPLGYLTIWPTGQPQPIASTLNSQNGITKADAAIVPAGTNGAISVYGSAATNVVLDIDGYFVASTPSALAFYPVTPCRLVDTRNADGPLGGPIMSAGQTRSFPLPNSTCNDIPANVQAYSLNFTVVPSGVPLGYLTTWPTGETQPVVSTLNASTGLTTANAAIVPAGTSGAIDVFTSNTTQVVIDINGYFAPPASGGLSFYTVYPCRVVNTENAAGPLGGPELFGSRNFPLTTSGCGLPTTAQAFSLNATVVPNGMPLGYLTLWPTGEPQPVVSTLNSPDGSTDSNAAIVPAGTNGSISAYASAGTQLILDTNGYFAP
jgi:virginiamycin B lyase